MNGPRYFWACIAVVTAASAPSLFLLVDRPAPDSANARAAAEWRLLLIPIGAAILAMLTQSRVRFINRAEAIARVVHDAEGAVVVIRTWFLHLTAEQVFGDDACRDSFLDGIVKFDRAIDSVQKELECSRMGLESVASKFQRCGAYIFWAKGIAVADPEEKFRTWKERMDASDRLLRELKSTLLE